MCRNSHVSALLLIGFAHKLAVAHQLRFMSTAHNTLSGPPPHERPATRCAAVLARILAGAHIGRWRSRVNDGDRQK